MKKTKSVPRQNFANSRKSLRKQKRQEKKVKRLEHYKNKNNNIKNNSIPGAFVKLPASASTKADVKSKKVKKPPISAQEVLNQQRDKDIKDTNKLKLQMDRNRKELLFKENEEEDKMIKKLEKQLGLNKVKNKKKYFADDGLDYLLEICDRSTKEQILATEKHLADMENDSDFEQDLAAVTGKDIGSKEKDKKKKKKEDSDEENASINEDNSDTEISADEQASEDDEFSDDDGCSDESGAEDHSGEEEHFIENQEIQELPIKKQKSKSKESAEAKQSKNEPNEDSDFSGDVIENPFSDDEVSHLSGDEESDGKVEKVKPDVWEDIYGRKRDKDGNIIKESKGAYVPPHLRNKDSSNDKELIQLKRQIKSVLNKLTGTNLHWASSTLESLFSRYSNNSVTSSIIELWLAATVGSSVTNDRMLVEHAAIVSVLHANVASQLGANLLEELSKRFDEILRKPLQGDDKSLVNIVSCLAYLYVFKLYHANLLYDILNALTTSPSELHIECVVSVLRCAGAVLRKEEPAALGEFTRKVQSELGTKADKEAKGSRVKFLLEVIMAVKNNNLTKIPNYDPSYAEQMKKTIRAVIRKGNYITPLNIRLEDLLKAEERGKWWIVGSAWEGNQCLNQSVKQQPSVPTGDRKLLELARKQRMNTDVRRSIFCVIMSAEDYMDALEKLNQLGLKGQQEREIIHVLLACCLQENTYNPYYAVLGTKLCESDRKYQLSIQFTVWDKIKDLESLSKQATSNLAQFLIHLIMEKALPLSVLKIIEFSDLNKTTVRFMRQILLAIIMNEDLTSSLAVFHKISLSSKLHMFRESLKLFIQHFLIRYAGKKTGVLSEKEMAVLRERAVEVERILSMHESKLRL